MPVSKSLGVLPTQPQQDFKGKRPVIWNIESRNLGFIGVMKKVECIMIARAGEQGISPDERAVVDEVSVYQEKRKNVKNTNMKYARVSQHHLNWCSCKHLLLSVYPDEFSRSSRDLRLTVQYTHTHTHTHTTYSHHMAAIK
jgi:hypothetical protein